MRYLSFLIAMLLSSTLYASTKSCATATLDPFGIMFKYSTEGLVALLRAAMGNQLVDGNLWVRVELVQDISDFPTDPPLSSAELAQEGRAAFYKKLASVIDVEGREDLPKMLDFAIRQGDLEFNGRRATQTIATKLELRVKDLLPVISWYVESLNHPALGNKVFKMSIVP